MACWFVREDSRSEGRAYAPIISVKTQPATVGNPTALALRPAAFGASRAVLGVLCARPGGPAERLAATARRDIPQSSSRSRCSPGSLLITAVSIGAGLLVTRVIEHTWGIGAADERVNVWLAAHRTPGRTHASLIGSIVAGGVVLPILVGVIALACAVLRKWRVAAFVVFALAVEVGDLPAHDPGRPLASAPRRPPRASAGRGQLPLRAYRCGGRGLRRSRAPHHVQVRERRAARARLGARSRDGRVRRAVAHVPRDASPARRGRRAARRPFSTGRGRLRLPHCGRGQRQPDIVGKREGRGRRPRRQDDRRRTAGAPSHPRGRGRDRPVLVRGPEEPQGAGTDSSRGVRRRAARLRLGRRRNGPARRR